VSYSQTYSEVVSGARTVSVSYPASERGGSTSVTVHVDIPISVTIGVDTRPFDYSVGNCVAGVTALAGALTGAGAAQTRAIAVGANKVADSILGGFFKLIRSELTQQISETKSRCNALLLKLADLKGACLSRKAQMADDFSRIADRYVKLFRDLDHELANRVHAIDASAFSVAREATDQKERLLSSNASTVATLISSEDSLARTTLGVRLLRGNAMALLQNATSYIAVDRRLNQDLSVVLSPDQTGAVRDQYVPILYTEAEGTGVAGQQAVVADTGSFKSLSAHAARQEIGRWFQEPKRRWAAMDGEAQIRIETFLRNYISASGAESGGQQARIGATIMGLWQARRPLALKG